MAKTKKEKTQFICQSCGLNSPRWLGKCTECGSWNSLVEEKVAPHAQSRSIIEKKAMAPVPLSKVQYNHESRINCSKKTSNSGLLFCLNRQI